MLEHKVAKRERLQLILNEPICICSTSFYEPKPSHNSIRILIHDFGKSRSKCLSKLGKASRNSEQFSLLFQISNADFIVINFLGVFREILAHIINI